MKNIIIYLLISLGCSLQLTAQDALFSLFDSNPLLINPAMAGDISNRYTHRAVAQHRTQWFDALGEDRYEYISIAYGRNFDICNTSKQSAFGIGINTTRESLPFNIFSDAVPNFQSNKVGLNIAYRRSISEHSYASVGFETEWLNNRLLTKGLRFPNQYDGLGNFASNNSSGESPIFDSDRLSNNAISLGAGLAITIQEIGLKKNPTSRKGSVQIGLAAYHLTDPNLSLLDNPDDQEANISTRWIAHARGSIPLTKGVDISPYSFYALQGKGVWQLIYGADFRMGLNEKVKLIPGIGIRQTNRLLSQQTINSVIFSARLKFENFFIAGATDIEFSPFAEGSNDNTVSTVEITLGYLWGKKTGTKCPMDCFDFL